MQPKHTESTRPARTRPRLTWLTLAGILWALPLSLCGLLMALPVLLARGRMTVVPMLRVSHAPGKRTAVPALLVSGRVGDFLLAHHPFGALHAMAIGHVVIADRTATSRRLLVHELVHVAQAARWGILFPFAYLVASACAFLSGGDVYWDNVFEVAARQAETHA